MSLQTELLFRIIFAALCGSAIGLERGIHRKDAGLRTHSIIAVAAAAYTVLSVYAFQDVRCTMDITQIACQIVSGISFLGAGAIYKNAGFGIAGLNTASGLWATAAIGMTCGIGMFSLAAFVTIWLLFLHVVLNRIHLDTLGYTVQEIRVESEDLEALHNLLRHKKKKYRASVLSCEYTRNEDRGTVTLSFRVKMLGTIPLKDVIRFLDENKEIKEISV